MILHYITAGRGPQPLVLIHSSFAGSRWWLPLFDHLLLDFIGQDFDEHIMRDA